MSKSIQELREERRDKVHAAQALTDQYQGDAWNAKTQAKYDALIRDIDGLDAELDRVQAVLARAAAGGTNLDQQPYGQRSDKRPPKNDEHTEAFWQFIRTGHDAGLHAFRANAAMTTGQGSDGGFMVPVELDGQIDETALNQSAMRTICEGRVVDTPEYQRIMSVHGTGSGWVGETEARPETATPKLELLKPYWGTLYAYPMVTQQMLDFSAYDVQGFLLNEVGEKFAQDQGSAFITGDGVKKPRGILDFDFTSEADAVRPFGTLQYLPTGSATDISFNTLQKTVFSLKRGYRQGSLWLMNSTTAGEIMQLKDGLGRPLWQPSVQQGQPPMLLGYPVEVDDFMPDAEGDAIPVLFGNFMRGFMILDLSSALTLRDPYSNKPYVGFYFVRRIGSMLKNSEAIRGVKISLS